MIHVITAANRCLYETYLEELFVLRHHIFVGAGGWIPVERPGCREIDAYDNEDAVYLLALEGECIVGGYRLNPTVKPNMLSDVFPHLASLRGVPEDLSVWEWSRCFVVKERCDGKFNLALMTAVQELCLDEGITEVSAVMETWWLPRFRDAGFNVRPLGLPALVSGEWTMAALIEISARTLDYVKGKAGIHGSVLVRRGRQRPLVDHRLVKRRRVMGARS